MSIQIIELYEYQIHNYEPINRYGSQYPAEIMYKFGEIDDSPETECSRISIENGIDSTDDTTRSSCDPITNKILEGGTQCLINFSPYDIDNIYDNYQKFIAKNKDIIFSLDNFEKIIKNLLNAFETQKKLYESSSDTKIKQHFTNVFGFKLLNELNQEISDYENNTAIIQKIIVDNNTKIVMFGDFHGSFHTFFRILCRLHRYDIINLDTFEIKDNYKIIFLGDIIDRGMYGLDILNIIFKMIIVNNKDVNNIKIIMNRGNHENYKTFNAYGFTKELSNKKNYNEEMYIYINLLLKLFCILPSAVIIHNKDNNNRFWCAHGGFPHKYVSENIEDNNLILIKNDDNINDIRWSDFENLISTEYTRNFNRGVGKFYSFTGTTKFLNTNNINFIIRGHQDSINNSVLFKNDSGTSKRLIGNPSLPNIDGLLYYNNNTPTYENRRNGPIARLIANKHDEYFPVLTISTNTDAGRDLNTDSFALLRFDIPLTEIENFNKYSLSVLKSIKKTLLDKNINKGDIILQNLTSIKEILEKINISNVIKYYIFNDFLNNFNENNEVMKFFISSIKNIYEDCISIRTYYTEKIDNIKNKYDRVNLGTIPSFQKYIDKYNEINKDITKLFDEINKIKKLVTIPENNKQTVYDLMNVFLEIKNIYTKYVLFNK